MAALRAAYRLGPDNDTIVAMPRIRLLPEHNARQGFPDAKEVAAICRRLPRNLADAVHFMFIPGWRSRSEVLPLTWAQVFHRYGRPIKSLRRAWKTACRRRVDLGFFA